LVANQRRQRKHYLLTASTKRYTNRQGSLHALKASGMGLPLMFPWAKTKCSLYWAYIPPLACFHNHRNARNAIVHHETWSSRDRLSCLS